MWQYDLTNPDEPALVGAYPYDNLKFITAGDGYLFGLDSSNNILVFDVHSSDGLALLETFQIYDGSPLDLAYQDGTLYVAVHNSGVAALKLNFENLK